MDRLKELMSTSEGRKQLLEKIKTKDGVNEVLGIEPTQEAAIRRKKK